MTGKDLSTVRKSWGMTQKQFGAVLGYSEKSIGNFESGRKPIPKSLQLHVISEQKLRQVREIIDSS